MAEQLFQIGVKAVIQNNLDEILLVTFVKPDGSMHMWDLPGGRMDPGEGFIDTLRRELKEEIGVRYLGNPDLITVVLSNITIPVEGKDIPLVLMAYRVTVDEHQNIKASEPNMIIEWVVPSEATKRLATKFPTDFCEQIAKL